jgi:hypothetical protein
MLKQITTSVKLLTGKPNYDENTDTTIEASYQTLIRAAEIEATLQAYSQGIIEVINQTNAIIAKS